jgi:hypothetical protein
VPLVTYLWCVVQTEHGETRVVSVHRSRAGARAAAAECLRAFWDDPCLAELLGPMPDDLDQAIACLAPAGVEFQINEAVLADD